MQTILQEAIDFNSLLEKGTVPEKWRELIPKFQDWKKKFVSKSNGHFPTCFRYNNQMDHEEGVVQYPYVECECGSRHNASCTDGNVTFNESASFSGPLG